MYHLVNFLIVIKHARSLLIPFFCFDKKRMIKICCTYLMTNLVHSKRRTSGYGLIDISECPHIRVFNSFLSSFSLFIFVVNIKKTEKLTKHFS